LIHTFQANQMTLNCDQTLEIKALLNTFRPKISVPHPRLTMVALSGTLRRERGLRTSANSNTRQCQKHQRISKSKVPETRSHKQTTTGIQQLFLKSILFTFVAAGQGKGKTLQSPVSTERHKDSEGGIVLLAPSAESCGMMSMVVWTLTSPPF